MLFRNEYDQLLRRAESVQRGQTLFGLPVMDISDLKAVGRQLDLLQRLYGLYSDVYKLAGSFEDQMWRDANIDDIETSLLALQTRYAYVGPLLTGSLFFSSYISLLAGSNRFQFQ
ncbi:unnamed protein product [Dibothriocephalus latus]|uniref:Dynein heavy chain tail domain-containing protein n=1 Tax=Dibothriocephalus latus TaxID=60516 RepID=A0A3P7NMV2_DIBLA|nr:unnamed protein product [Dibothriocephalus latus]